MGWLGYGEKLGEIDMNGLLITLLVLFVMLICSIHLYFNEQYKQAKQLRDWFYMSVISYTSLILLMTL